MHYLAHANLTINRDPSVAVNSIKAIGEEVKKNEVNISPTYRKK